MDLRDRIDLLIALSPDLQDLLWSEDRIAAALEIGRLLKELSSPAAKRIILEIVERSRRR